MRTYYTKAFAYQHHVRQKHARAQAKVSKRSWCSATQRFAFVSSNAAFSFSAASDSSCTAMHDSHQVWCGTRKAQLMLPISPMYGDFSWEGFVGFFQIGTNTIQASAALCERKPLTLPSLSTKPLSSAQWLPVPCEISQRWPDSWPLQGVAGCRSPTFAFMEHLATEPLPNASAPF